MFDYQLFHVEHSPFGLYIHVPFCLKKCIYCGFCSVINTSLIDRYLDVLTKEIGRSAVAGLKPRTVYVGGGTPSCIGVRNVERALRIVGEAFDLSEILEYTFECNPEDVDDELAAALAGNGVNRVSMGVQSLDDKMLKFLGRRHKAAKVGEAIGSLRKAGIGNISVDCIYGLPRIDGFDPLADIDRFLALGVEHMSFYSLQYEENAQITRMVERGDVDMMSDDDVCDLYDALVEKMRGAGYVHYELSNFAKLGRESKHNLSYWDRVPYWSFGPAAASFDGKVRVTNTCDVEEYLASEGQKKSLVEKLTDEQIFIEQVMLKMRKSDGLNLSEIDDRYMPSLREKLGIEMKEGKVVRLANGNYAIPEGRWMVSDSIIGRLALI